MNINFNKQFANFWKIFLVLILLLNIVLLCVFGLSAVYSLPMEDLLEDPASVYGYSQFAGFITFVGVVILATGIGAVILALSFISFKTVEKKEIVAVALLALINLFLILDDLFLLHERIFTGLFQVGERRIFLAYLICFCIFVAIFRKQVLSGPTIFFIIAMLLFGLSLATDILSDKVPLNEAFIDSIKMLEEGCKLGGYLFWTAFIMLKAKDVLQAEIGMRDS